jgi:glycosyltransferase involved in cell wall biosynthesis
MKNHDMEETMKIALYAGIFKKDQDGATKTLYELTDSLLDKGMEIGVWGYKVTPQQRKGLQLYKMASVPIPLYPEYRVTCPTRKLKKQLLEFQPDVIHVAAPDFTGRWLMRIAEEQDIPVLTSFHTDFPSYLKYYKLGFLYEWSWGVLRRFYNHGRIVMAPSREMMEKLKEHGIQQVKLWSRGIHLDRYNPGFRSNTLREKWGAKGKKVILYCGRFVWYKDLETFCGVYDRFKREGRCDTVFVLAGDGPIKEELKQRMPDAIFPGYLTGKDLSVTYASSDLLLFPSTTEAFGNVVLEALASGIPAVVSNTGGCREIIANSNGGLIAEAGSIESFYRCCTRLLDDRKFYSIRCCSGYDYAQEQSWPLINNRVMEEYRRISANNGNENYNIAAVSRLLVSHR